MKLFTALKTMSKILSCDFEVFGVVQGVSFRMYTERQAKSLGIKGWCMNTRNDTVKGQIEGPPEPFKQMQNWLEKTGSPTSRIDKAVFSQPKELNEYTFKNFEHRIDQDMNSERGSNVQLDFMSCILGERN